MKVLERNLVDDKDGKPIHVFSGYYEKTINGHEMLRGKIHKFFEDGKWYQHPGSIHDLAKELVE